MGHGIGGRTAESYSSALVTCGLEPQELMFRYNTTEYRVFKAILPSYIRSRLR